MYSPDKYINPFPILNNNSHDFTIFFFSWCPEKRNKEGQRRKGNTRTRMSRGRRDVGSHPF